MTLSKQKYYFIYLIFLFINFINASNKHFDITINGQKQDYKKFLALEHVNFHNLVFKIENLQANDNTLNTELLLNKIDESKVSIQLKIQKSSDGIKINNEPCFMAETCLTESNVYIITALNKTYMGMLAGKFRLSHFLRHTLIQHKDNFKIIFLEIFEPICKPIAMQFFGSSGESLINLFKKMF